MPVPLSIAVRQSIIFSHKQGERISKLSRKFAVSRSTIYTLIAREEKFGLSGLAPRYERCGKSRPSEDDFIYRAVKCLRNWHPNWGAQKIHAEIHLMRPKLVLPHYRTLTRWFRWNGNSVFRLSQICPGPI